MPAIEVSQLTKSFRTYKKQPGFRGAVKGLLRRKYEQTLAVSEVSFTIEPGELVGFLGPNGAGKTTTLKMLSGLLYPTSGSARVLGFVPWERQDGYRRQFALLLGVEVHRPLVTHRVERITVFGDAASAADRRCTAIEAAGMKQAEVVSHFVSDDLRDE